MNPAAELTESVRQVLSSMVNMNSKLAEVFEAPSHAFESDISALLGLMASKFSGTVTLHCSELLAKKFMAAMLMCDVPSEPGISNDVSDAMGEIANVVIGNFKVALSNALGEAVKMTVPTVIVGKGHVTRTMSSGYWLAIRFDVEGENLWIEVLLRADSAT
jgi:chemotaxis protein CheX